MAGWLDKFPGPYKIVGYVTSIRRLDHDGGCSRRDEVERSVVQSDVELELELTKADREMGRSCSIRQTKYALHVIVIPTSGCFLRLAAIGRRRGWYGIHHHNHV